MKVSSKFLKEMIREEMSLIYEDCGAEAETGHECPVCTAGLECPCDDEDDLGDFRNLNQTNISPDEAFTSGCSVCGDDHDSHDHDIIAHGTITGVEGGEPDFDHDGFGPDERLFSKDEALRVVAAIAQNTSCPVTRNALMGVIDDLGSGGGEEWVLDDEEEVDVDWSNPQYGHFKGDIEGLESKDDAFGVGYSMGQSGDFDEPDDRLEGG